MCATPDIAKPAIIVDTREQAPLRFEDWSTVRDTLPVGDYGIQGFSDWSNPRFVIERKSVSDLCGSVGKGRARFMREVEKMRQFGFRALVIEGTRQQIEAGDYQSMMHPASLLSTLDALSVRTGLHVFWCVDSRGAAKQVESLARMFCRGVEKDAQRLMATG